VFFSFLFSVSFFFTFFSFILCLFLFSFHNLFLFFFHIHRSIGRTGTANPEQMLHSSPLTADIQLKFTPPYDPVNASPACIQI